ncbi:hypothetical protein AB0M29_42445 [Streptomyces sp. NPDC051976]|uniref:DivIVA domain-containing protein n=1 Tax=Streptomyces sp. NPDC051976 TaxID=3154947 RepID=UPI003413BDA0
MSHHQHQEQDEGTSAHGAGVPDGFAAVMNRLRGMDEQETRQLREQAERTEFGHQAYALGREYLERGAHDQAARWLRTAAGHQVVGAQHDLDSLTVDFSEPGDNAAQECADISTGAADLISAATITAAPVTVGDLLSSWLTAAARQEIHAAQLAAHQSADSDAVRAQRQAERILGRARLEADQILTSAQREADEIRTAAHREAEALRAAAQAETVAQTSSPPLVHGDLRPANVLVRTDGWTRLIDYLIVEGPSETGVVSALWRHWHDSLTAPARILTSHTPSSALSFTHRTLQEFLGRHPIQHVPRRSEASITTWQVFISFDALDHFTEPHVSHALTPHDQLTEPLWYVLAARLINEVSAARTGAAEEHQGLQTYETPASTHYQRCIMLPAVTTHRFFGIPDRNILTREQQTTGQSSSSVETQPSAEADQALHTQQAGEVRRRERRCT